MNGNKNSRKAVTLPAVLQEHLLELRYYIFP